jgi:hypothetical protein
MCGKSFNKFVYKDCKIIAFEVKKKIFFTLCKTRSTNFESSWLKNFALHKVEDFDIALRKLN